MHNYDYDDMAYEDFDFSGDEIDFAVVPDVEFDDDFDNAIIEDSYVVDDFDGFVINTLTKTFDEIYNSLDKYESKPVPIIKEMSKEINELCDVETLTLIDKNPVLKIVYEKVKNRINACEKFYDDVCFALELDKEFKGEDMKDKEKIVDDNPITKRISKGLTIEELRDRYKRIREEGNKRKAKNVVYDDRDDL